MFLVGILSWWYGEGIIGRIKMVKERLAASMDFFSVDLLISTLFSPFKQISANSGGRSFNEIMQAFFDKLISRLIGAVVRMMLILFGIFVLIFQVLFGVILLLMWLLMPLFPMVGLILFVLGWTPQWI